MLDESRPRADGQRYTCWCDGTACDGTTTVPFTVCDECKRFGHRALPSMGLPPEDLALVEEEESHA